MNEKIFIIVTVNSPQKFDSNRLTKLSSFQLDVVSHAMKCLFCFW